jgi:sugar phosphate isomerase/epimerase
VDLGPDRYQHLQADLAALKKGCEADEYSAPVWYGKGKGVHILMKLAYSTLACPQWTIEEAVTAAAGYGYNAIEWRLADGEIITPEISSDVRRRLRDVPARSGIAIACLDTSCRVVQESSQARAQVTEEVQRMADMAVELGAPFLRLFGGPLPRGETHSSMMAPTAEVLHTIGAYCAERNITAVLETHDAWSSSAVVTSLITMTASPAMKVLWDIHHTYRAGETPSQSVACLGAAIAYVHVKDGRPSIGAPGAWELCPLDEGIVPLREAFSSLKCSGYNEYLSLEWEKKWHPEIAEPDGVLPPAVSWLRCSWEAA